MNEELSFRDTVYRDSFRFEVTPNLWKALYGLIEDGKKSNLITIVEEGRLRGYAICYFHVRDQFKAVSVLDIAADAEAVFDKLIDQLVEHSKRQDADFIYIEREASPYDEMLDKKGFLSFVNNIVMVVLLNPHELLRVLSHEVKEGKRLRLNIEGFDSITVRVGKDGIQIATDEKPDLTVSTDSGTFLKLFFCQTSLWKELLRRKIKVIGVLKLPTASRFFKLIQQEKWHIPYGDWV